MPYAVIDFESTGYCSGGNDRIVEIAVVLVREDGVVEAEWDTIVNPLRDVGATYLHGISNRHVLGAPTFADLAPRLVRDLTGRVLVGHQAKYNADFLRREFERVRVKGIPSFTVLSTMDWCREVFGTSKLRECCEAAGVALPAEHQALTDARATAGLLQSLLYHVGYPPPWEGKLARAHSAHWPTMRMAPSSLKPRRDPGETAQPVRQHWLDQLLRGTPAPVSPDIDPYFQCLQVALFDQYLSRHEIANLVKVAGDVGLSREQVERVHRSYLEWAATAAIKDGKVASEEFETLDDFASLLGLPDGAVEHALAQARTSPRIIPTPTKPLDMFTLSPGDKVVFTGSTTTHRKVWEERLAAAGLRTGKCSKDAKLVVARDPDIATTKTEKAREHGVPIITERRFEQMMTDFVGQTSS